jgi:hypothetical protein
MTDVTRILSAIDQGDSRAAEQLLPLVYNEPFAYFPAAGALAPAIARGQPTEDLFRRRQRE